MRSYKKSVVVRLLSNDNDCVALAKYYTGDKGGWHTQCAGFVLKEIKRKRLIRLYRLFTAKKVILDKKSKQFLQS